MSRRSDAQRIVRTELSKCLVDRRIRENMDVGDLRVVGRRIVDALQPMFTELWKNNCPGGEISFEEWYMDPEGELDG